MIRIGATDGDAGKPDSSRLARLFDAHYNRLFRLARRLSGNREEAQDLVQEAFVRIARAERGIPAGVSDEEAWLVRVLVNLCRDRWRRVKVRSAVPLMNDISTPSPERRYEARLAVQAALAGLDPRRRAIVVMHELEDINAASIARVLGLSPITVRWHLSRARVELGRALGAGIAEQGESNWSAETRERQDA